jgi:hypothetical protein
MHAIILQLTCHLLLCRENQSAEILPSEVDEKMTATDNKNYVDDGGNVLPSKLEVICYY